MNAERLGGPFDSVIMNPPFKNGADVRHVLRARALPAPGGRLISIVADGPRQRARLRPLTAAWIDLPAGSLQGEGTTVQAAIVVIDA
jgi:hypothetical protein